jgi:hypothetical protein
LRLYVCTLLSYHDVSLNARVVQDFRSHRGEEAKKLRRFFAINLLARLLARVRFGALEVDENYDTIGRSFGMNFGLNGKHRKWRRSGLKCGIPLDGKWMCELKRGWQGRRVSHPIQLVLLCNSFTMLLRRARLFTLMRNKYQARGELNKQAGRQAAGKRRFFASISRTHYNKMTLRARVRRMGRRESFIQLFYDGAFSSPTRLSSLSLSSSHPT